MNLTQITKHAVLAGALSVFAATSYGSSLSLYSSATETTNNSGLATVNIPKNPSWAAPLPGSSWVSYVQSGDPSSPGYISPANGTVVTFVDTFFVGGTPLNGILSVLADDSASVTLNGQLLTAEASSTGNGYTTCSNTSIGCLAVTQGNVSLTGHLVSGLNTLSFAVAQRAGVSFGLDYAGTVNYTATPEPGTIALMGLPLLVLGLIRRKRSA